MERRTLLRLGMHAAAVAALPTAVSAQNAAPLIPDLYLADKYVAPKDAPSTVVITGPSEPGERLIVSIYAFHADKQGLYEQAGASRGIDPGHARCQWCVARHA